MLTELCALNRSPGLDWAVPLIAYAFARHGKSTILLASAVEDPDGPDWALFALRDPEFGAPWFSAARLKILAAELEGVMNQLKGEGPGGVFKVGSEKAGLRVSWGPQNRPGAPQ